MTRMTRQELQAALKEIRNNDIWLQVKLNASTEALMQEYDRINSYLQADFEESLESTEVSDKDISNHLAAQDDVEDPLDFYNDAEQSEIRNQIYMDSLVIPACEFEGQPCDDDDDDEAFSEYILTDEEFTDEGMNIVKVPPTDPSEVPTTSEEPEDQDYPEWLRQYDEANFPEKHTKAINRLNKVSAEYDEYWNDLESYQLGQTIAQGLIKDFKSAQYAQDIPNTSVVSHGSVLIALLVALVILWDAVVVLGKPLVAYLRPYLETLYQSLESFRATQLVPVYVMVEKLFYTL